MFKVLDGPGAVQVHCIKIMILICFSVESDSYGSLNVEISQILEVQVLSVNLRTFEKSKY